MHKKIALITCLCCLLCACVLAEAPETREETIYIEGMPETITLTRFDSDEGYTLWLDMNLFKIESNLVDDKTDTISPVYGDIVSDIYMDIIHTEGMALDDAIAEAAKTLTENGYAAEPIDTAQLFDGFESRGLRAAANNTLCRYYILETDLGLFHIAMAYPQEAAEGFGARMETIVDTFELTDLP